MGALSQLSKQLPRASKLILANGLLISKVSYMIQLWGAAADSHIQKVQVVVNKAARLVTGHNKRTSTAKFMSECGWLHVKDMIKYYSLVSLWNIVHRRIPAQLHDKITHDDIMIITTTAPRLMIVARGFRHRAIANWNQMSEEIRCQKSLPKFKKSVKQWLKSQYIIDPDPLMNPD